MSKETLEELEEMVERLEMIKFTYDRNKDEIKALDGERNDLFHMAEIGKYNAYEGYCYFKRLGDISKKRRNLKDQNEVLQPFLNMAYQGAFKMSGLKDALKKSRDKVNVQEARSYRVREREDLESKINH